MTDTKQIDPQSFHAILASSVHDMKNTLSVLNHAIVELVQELQPAEKTLINKLTQIECLGTELNNHLMQLLAIYKIDNQQYPFSNALQPLHHCLDEQVLRYAELAARQDLSINIDCAEDLMVPYDYPLVGGVINNCLGNALRYAKSQIHITAIADEQQVEITVEDDGDGFPEAILMAQGSGSNTIDYVESNTGLGLFFCDVVAKLHRNGEMTGAIRFDNDSRLGGARFVLSLPLL